MTPLAFFRKPEVVRAVERASRCAAAPVTVHFMRDGREGLKTFSYGHCAACRYVAQLPGGAGACRASREPAAATALRRHTPTAFICHLGFACIVAPVFPDPDLGFTMTFGPYCPAEEPHSLDADVWAGLSALRGPESDLADELPISLDDVHVVPANAVPEILEWTLDELAMNWEKCQSAVAASEPVAALRAAPERPRRRARRMAQGDPYQAGAIAAALAGGKQDQARALVRAALSETQSPRRARLAVRRARTVGLVAAVLEAAERAEIGVAACWDRFPEFVAEAQRARTDLQLVNAGLGLLSILKRKAVREAPESLGYVEINEIVLQHLTDGITLNEVARQLGQHPTAITHRLQRKFGLSYSEYVGRLRVDKAKELLRRTRLSITEVAHRVGVNDPSNFGKLFRKSENLSPQEYRARYGRPPGRE